MEVKEKVKRSKYTTSSGKNGALPVEGVIGRPKSISTIRADAIRNKISEIVHTEAEAMVKAMVLSAKGEVWIEKETKDGTFREQKAPDVNAYRTLTEQAIGTPTQTVAFTGKVGIVQLIKQLEGADIDV